MRRLLSTAVLFTALIAPVASTAAQEMPITSITGGEVLTPVLGPRYVVVEIETLGGPSANAMAINDNGEIVGAADNAQWIRHAYAWSLESGMVDLDPFFPGIPSEASGINEFGNVVGYRMNLGSGRLRATHWSPAGDAIELGAPHSSDSFAIAINDNGEIAGSIGYGPPQAVCWDASFALKYLPSPGNASLAWDINDGGVIVGSSATTAGSSTAEQAAIWRLDASSGQISGPEFLGTFTGSNYSEAIAINDRGTVVGWMRRAGTDIAFFSPPAESGQQRRMIAIGRGQDVRYSHAKDINNRGEVVGVFGTGQIDHAFRWTSRDGWSDLNRLVVNDPEKQWTLVHAAAINDRGEITGYGVLGGSYRSFLLVPVGSKDRAQ